MEQPLVSIVVPVYNAKTHIARCIESIRAQTYRNLEIILLNDGSKDVSLPVCEMFRRVDDRILLVDKDNSGVSDTRNLGLKLAQGKYIQFVDSDDYLAPDYTENLVTNAEQSGADLVIAHYNMVIPRGVAPVRELNALVELGEKLHALPEDQPEPEVRVYGFLPEGAMDKNTFALHLMDRPASFYYGVLWNKLYRRDLLTQHELCFFSEINWCEDFLFNLQYIRYANTFYATEKPGYYYVQNPQSICHTKVNVVSIAQMKREMFHYYKELYEQLGLYEENRLAIHKYLVDVAESTLPSLPLPKAVEEAKESLREKAAEYKDEAVRQRGNQF